MIAHLFTDRRAAGRRLGRKLARLQLDDPLVLGLARGGMPVAFEVAQALDAPLDVFVVRKLGVPRHEELAMGAIASGGVRALNTDVIESLHIPPLVVEAIAVTEADELTRRERRYRADRPFPDVRGRTVVAVDDGAATGASMLAAVRALRQLGAQTIVAAAPVVSRQARDVILDVADACEHLVLPEPFYSVGTHYEQFGQTADDEVRELLAANRRPSVNGNGAIAG